MANIKFVTMDMIIEELYDDIEVGCCFTNNFFATEMIRKIGLVTYCELFKLYYDFGKHMGNGFVYLIKGQYKDKIAYKIGKTNSLKERLRKFEVIIPFDIELVTAFFVRNSLDFESLLHKKFKHKNIAGEWFDLDEVDIANIEILGLKKESEDFIINIELNNKNKINKDDYIQYLEGLLALHKIEVKYGKK